MTSKEKVLSVYPDAHSYLWGGFWYVYRYRGLKDADLIGTAQNEAEAWDDAASKLPSAPSPAEETASPEKRVVQPIPCPTCNAPIFTRANKTIVAHFNGDGDRCKASETVIGCDCAEYVNQVCDICQGVSVPEPVSPEGCRCPIGRCGLHPMAATCSLRHPHAPEAAASECPACKLGTLKIGDNHVVEYGATIPCAAPIAPAAEETAREKLRLAYALLDNYPEDQLVDMGKAKVLIGEVIATADKCEGGESCWHNPQTGYLEACPKHEAIAMDRMMEIEASRRAQPEPVSPEGSAEDEIDALINEVAPPPLVVSETAVRQLRPLLLELIARRKAEELIQELREALQYACETLNTYDPVEGFTRWEPENLLAGARLKLRNSTRAEEYRKGANNV